MGFCAYKINGEKVMYNTGYTKEMVTGHFIMQTLYHADTLLRGHFTTLPHGHFIPRIFYHRTLYHKIWLFVCTERVGPD